VTRTWHVACGDFFNYMKPDDEWVVDGFQTAEAAREYARRFIRARLERMRQADAEETLSQYYAFGEYASAIDLDTREWVQWCIANPATRPEHTDYAALDPRVKPEAP
jgi:hypothetical protein